MRQLNNPSFKHNCHDHHNHSHLVAQNLKIAFFLNFFFSILEVGIGFFSNSLSVLTDALHDFGDTISIGSSLFFEKYSNKSRDSNYTYGYKRFSLLGVFVSTLILFVGSVLILVESIPRIFEPRNVYSELVILVSVIGILTHVIAFIRLKKGKSLVEKTINLHILEDLFGWFSVLVGSIFMYFFNWYWIDSVLSVGISIFILVGVFRNFKYFIGVLLQGIPKNLNVENISKEFQNLPNVRDIHDMHIWSMDGNYVVFTAHIKIDDSTTKNDILLLKETAKRILKKFGIHHETIEFEYASENCEFIHC